MGNLKYVFIAAIIIVLGTLLFIPHGSSSKYKNTASETDTDGIKLENISNINYAFKTIKPEIADFLKTSGEYGAFYNDGRKFVIYFTGADCPYGAAFESAVSPLVNNENFKNYQFYPANASDTKMFDTVEQANKEIAFSNLCKEFCIVNPKKDKLFRIDGVGQNEADQIEKILIQLKDW